MGGSCWLNGQTKVCHKAPLHNGSQRVSLIIPHFLVLKYFFLSLYFSSFLPAFGNPGRVKILHYVSFIERKNIFLQLLQSFLSFQIQYYCASVENCNIKISQILNRVNKIEILTNHQHCLPKRVLEASSQVLDPTRSHMNF